MFLNRKDGWRKRTHENVLNAMRGGCRKKRERALWQQEETYFDIVHLLPLPSRSTSFGEFKRVIFHENHLFMVATPPQDEKKSAFSPSSKCLPATEEEVLWMQNVELIVSDIKTFVKASIAGDSKDQRWQKLTTSFLHPPLKGYALIFSKMLRSMEIPKCSSETRLWVAYIGRSTLGVLFRMVKHFSLLPLIAIQLFDLEVSNCCANRFYYIPLVIDRQTYRQMVTYLTA